jgi:predicted TIM-barrel fold metal-dependent hydrolase
MPVIDAHSHFAECRVFDLDNTEDDLLGGMNDNDIDIAIVQPYPGANSAKVVHDGIAALGKKHPGRIFGMASINPHLMDSQAYFDELSRCVKELGFVGVKLHAIGHALNPAGTDGTTIFESASQLGIPVMMHTGPGIPFAAPSAVTPQLKRFPNVPVVLGHAGHGIFSGEAIAVADAFPQVSLEPTWCAFYNVGAMVEAVGPGRVMFGTDLPGNAAVMVETFRALGLSKADMDMVMGGSAKEIFKLDI